jgi:hypothetical protein
VLSPEAAAALHGPPTVDGICEPRRWSGFWREVDARRRAACDWWRGLGLPEAIVAAADDPAADAPETATADAVSDIAAAEPEVDRTSPAAAAARDDARTRR